MSSFPLSSSQAAPACWRVTLLRALAARIRTDAWSQALQWRLLPLVHSSNNSCQCRLWNFGLSRFLFIVVSRKTRALGNGLALWLPPNLGGCGETVFRCLHGGCLRRPLLLYAYVAILRRTQRTEETLCSKIELIFLVFGQSFKSRALFKCNSL